MPDQERREGEKGVQEQSEQGTVFELHKLIRALDELHERRKEFITAYAEFFALCETDPELKKIYLDQQGKYSEFTDPTEIHHNHIQEVIGQAYGIVSNLMNYNFGDLPASERKQVLEFEIYLVKLARSYRHEVSQGVPDDDTSPSDSPSLGTVTADRIRAARQEVPEGVFDDRALVADDAQESTAGQRSSFAVADILDDEPTIDEGLVEPLAEEHEERTDNARAVSLTDIQAAARVDDTDNQSIPTGPDTSRRETKAGTEARAAATEEEVDDSSIIYAVESREKERKPGETNEDSFLADIKKRVFAVFDGMGGHAAGSEASAFARDALVEKMEHMPTTDVESIKEYIKNALQEMSISLFEKAAEKPETRGMGTTCSMVKIWEGQNGEKKAIIGNVGDSRIYIRRANGDLELITLDDTYATEELKKEGGEDNARKFYEAIDRVISNAEFEKLGTMHQLLWKGRRGQYLHLSQCLGKIDEQTGEAKVIEPRMHVLDVKPGDRIIITSDGVHDNLTRDEMQRIAGLGTANEATKKLIAESHARSLEPKGNDNIRSKPDDITALLIEVGGESSGTATGVRDDGVPAPSRSSSLLEELDFSALLQPEFVDETAMTAKLREYIARDGRLFIYSDTHLAEGDWKQIQRRIDKVIQMMNEAGFTDKVGFCGPANGHMYNIASGRNDIQVSIQRGNWETEFKKSLEQFKKRRLARDIIDGDLVLQKNVRLYNDSTFEMDEKMLSQRLDSLSDILKEEGYEREKYGWVYIFENSLSPSSNIYNRHIAFNLGGNYVQHPDVPQEMDWRDALRTLIRSQRTRTSLESAFPQYGRVRKLFKDEKTQFATMHDALFVRGEAELTERLARLAQLIKQRKCRDVVVLSSGTATTISAYYDTYAQGQKHRLVVDLEKDDWEQQVNRVLDEQKVKKRK